MPPLSASSGLFLRSAVGAALIGAAILLIAKQDPSGRIRMPSGQSASMAIEHVVRLTPTIGIANLRDRARISVNNDEVVPIAVSVPEHWTRGEVTGVRLQDVVSSPPAFGFIRWTLPSSGTIVFESPSRIDHLELFNPSGIPLHVILRRTDILTGTAREDTILVQESPTKLF